MFLSTQPSVNDKIPLFKLHVFGALLANYQISLVLKLLFFKPALKPYYKYGFQIILDQLMLYHLYESIKKHISFLLLNMKL